LDSDVLSGNQAVGDALGNAFGGAVYCSAGASLTIENTSFVNNQANGTNNSFGGALANVGSLSITGATFTANSALGSTTNFGSSPGGSAGGAIGNLDGATATINLSTFTGNQAEGIGAGSAAGGAICNQDAFVFPFTASGITCSVSQCTFANNLAKGGSMSTNGGYGGALEDLPGVSLSVFNCSFTGNQANSGGDAALGIDTVGFAPRLREDVVDVDAFIEVGLQGSSNRHALP
jgi:hypothetical protein